jgi:hypothetical protein
MDSFKFDFCDFVGAAIPGIPILILSCFSVTSTTFSFENLVITLKSISITEVSLAILISYCIGFCLHYPAYELFQLIMKKWDSKRTKGLPISIGKREKELVTIRHKSPENFRIISKFLALRQMSYTMFISLLICFTALLNLWIIYGVCSRSVLTALFLTSIFGFLFLRRSVAFHQRIQEMITESHEFSLRH